MSYTEILVLICLCIFVVVLLYITVQLTKGINLQIRTCGKMAKWAKQELERKEERRMSDLINRQDAIYALEEQLDYLNMLNKDENPTAESNWYGVNWARNTIADLPSAERKRGEWIQHDNEPNLWSCSVCETVIYSEHEEDRLKFHKWCGCCGADMRGDENDKVNTTDA